MAISKIVPKVYAADVTDEVVGSVSLPPGVQFVLTDGFAIDVPKGTVDVAFSDQVLEHLHPDDAAEQVQAIRSLLAPGGVYICITPNRLYGPHDVSQYFDPVATGLHLKEYTVSEVARLFRRCGFSEVSAYSTSGNQPAKQVSLAAVAAVERCLDNLPRRLSHGLACSAGIKWLLRSRIVGHA
jgi:SAM-dependent methyltransferase